MEWMIVESQALLSELSHPTHNIITNTNTLYYQPPHLTQTISLIQGEVKK